MTIQEQCVCCGETFKLIGDLFEHIRKEHSEQEVLSALAKKDDNTELSA